MCFGESCVVSKEQLSYFGVLCVCVLCVGWGNLSQQGTGTVGAGGPDNPPPPHFYFPRVIAPVITTWCHRALEFPSLYQWRRRSAIVTPAVFVVFVWRGTVSQRSGRSFIGCELADVSYR